MLRARRRLLLLLLPALLLGGPVWRSSPPAGAQTTPTTQPPATTVPTTTATPTTVPATSPPATTEPASDQGSDGGRDIPWVAIAIGVAALVLVVVAVAMLARGRGAARRARADWRRRAAEVTAEAGATARLLSTGAPATGQIAQQIVATLRSFEELAESAPDDDDEDIALRARRALQTLGLAIDAEYRTRRSAGAGSDETTRAEEALQATAGETDRTLRGVYRRLTNQR